MAYSAVNRQVSFVILSVHEIKITSVTEHIDAVAHPIGHALQGCKGVRTCGVKIRQHAVISVLCAAVYGPGVMKGKMILVRQIYTLLAVAVEAAGHDA